MRTKSTWGTLLAGLVLAGFFDLFAGEPRILVYQKNSKGFVHDNLAASAAAIQEMGTQNGFGVDVSTNPVVFKDVNLKKYAALIFANSNNEAFENAEQRAAFQRFIRHGGGFMGIHSSTGSERQWDYFQQLQGAKFLRHSPLQRFSINVLDSRHPATAHLAAAWKWEDECYFFTNLNPRMSPSVPKTHRCLCCRSRFSDHHPCVCAWIKRPRQVDPHRPDRLWPDRQ